MKKKIKCATSWFGLNKNKTESEDILTAMGIPRDASEIYFKECGNDIVLATRLVTQNTRADYTNSEGLALQ